MSDADVECGQGRGYHGQDDEAAHREQQGPPRDPMGDSHG